MQAQYKTYDSYKDSGTEWLEMIPSSWELQSIRAVTELKSQKNQPDLQVLSVYREYGVIQKDSRDDNHNVTSEDTSNYKAVAPGDLVVNKMKAWQGSMGVSEHHGIVSPAYITCKTKSEKVLPRFLHYLLRSQPFISVYNALSYGVRIGQWDMHYEDFKKIALAYPSISEQERIVAFLDQKTGEIDAAIEKKQRLIELLKEQKSILINQAVTKGLNPSAPMKDSGIEWIGQIPAHWEVKRIKHFAKIGSGFAFKSDKFSAEGTPVIRIGDIAKPIQPDSCVKTSEVKIPDMFKVVAGDVLIALSGATTGKIGFYDSSEIAFVNQRVALIRNSEKWFRHLLDADFLQRQIKLIAAGSAQENISTGSIANIFAPIPPANERAEIANWLLSLESECDKTINQQLSSIEKLQEFKQTLIAHAVTGKIKV